MSRKKSSATPSNPKEDTKQSYAIFRDSRVQAALLIVILAIGVALRTMLLQWGYYLNEYDPFFFYRVAQYIAKNGFQAWSTWHDTLSWSPMGRNIALSSYPGVSFSAVIIYDILAGIGLRVNLLDVAMFFPVFMSTLTIIVAYFIGKDLGGKLAGFCAAIILAVSPNNISRTVAGFFNTDSAGIFGIATVMLLFTRSLDEKKDIRWRILYALGAGLATGYTFASWGAARYITGLLSLFTVVWLLLGRSNRRLILSYSITMGVGLLISVMVPHLGVSSLMNVENLAVPLIILLLLSFDFASKRVSIERLQTIMFTLIIVGLLALIILPNVGIGRSLSGKFLQAVNPFSSQTSLYASIGENKLASWDSFFQDFGIEVFLGAIGVYIALKGLNEIKLYSILFFLTAIYFTGTLVRLLPFLAFPVSIGAAYGLVQIIEPLKIYLSQPKSLDKRRNKMIGASKSLSVLVIILLLFSFIPIVSNAQATGDSPGPLASSGVPILVNGKYPTDWVDALNWIKANTTKGSVVCAWWDYGYWLETVANRTTIADGATLNGPQIVQLAHIMIDPNNVSLPIMKKFNASYCVVFVTFNPNKPITGRVATPNEEESYPLGDNAKWMQMALIAGYNQMSFYKVDTKTGQVSYTSKYTNSTIARMMYQTTDPNHFQLVYRSKLGWVLVYKITY